MTTLPRRLRRHGTDAHSTGPHNTGPHNSRTHNSRTHLRRLGTAALVVVLAVGGAWIALLVGGTDRQDVGPASATLSLQPATSGGTTIAFPPLGDLRLDTHQGPLRLHVAVDRLDPEQVREIAAEPTMLNGLKSRVISDVRGAMAHLLVRDLLVALAGAVLLTGLVLRRLRATVTAGLVAVATMGGCYGVAFTTWNTTAIAHPRYTGLLTSAPAVVGDAQEIVEDFSVYGDQLGALVTNVSGLYTATSTLPVMSETDYLRVLHVSDLELAPQAWDVISATAAQYDVDVVVDSGDTTDHGSAAENGYLQGVRRIDAPYVWVRGNHDSMRTQRAMQQLPGVVVLDGEVEEVAGIRFLGAGDPRFTPDKRAALLMEDAVSRRADVLADVAERDGAVDVVVYHDPQPTAVFDGLADMVMSGHIHMNRHTQLPGGTWKLVEGSTGGSGLRALEPGEPYPIQMSLLYLDPDSAQLRAWDHFTLGGLGLASARIERHIVPPQEGDDAVLAADPDLTAPAASPASD